jgi:hypothetical protein
MAIDSLEGQDARERADTASTQDVVMLLRAILGPQLVLSIAGARTPACVGGWAQGRGRPAPDGEMRLRIALELALIVLEGEGLDAARAWISRRDPLLDGRSPLGVLAQESPRIARRELLRSARASLSERAALVRSGPLASRH